MVVIRLARGGSRNRPYYYIVVADSKSRRDGRFIEKIGFYNPILSAELETFKIDLERYEHWISVGAQPSPTVKKIVKNKGKTKVAGTEEKANNSKTKVATTEEKAS